MILACSCKPVNLLKAVLFSVGLISLHGIAQDLSIIRPEYYMGLPAKYGQLPFVSGPIEEVTAPAPAFRSLFIPTYEGLPRFGIQDSYLVADKTKRQQFGPTQNERQAVTKRLTDDADQYLGLMALRFALPHLTAEKISYYDPTRGMTNQYYKYRSYQPRFYVSVLSYGLLSEAAFKAFFCAEGQPCDPGYDRIHHYNDGTMASYMQRWGGPTSNEFRTRAALDEFLTSHLETLKAWSQSLRAEVAIVGNVELGDYDFARNGFNLELSPPKGQSAPRTTAYQYYEVDSSRYHLENKFGQQQHSTFLSMPPNQAEALVEDIKANYGQQYHPRVFFVIRARIHDISLDQPDFHGGNICLYDLASPVVSLYKDESLKHKIADVSFAVK